MNTDPDSPIYDDLRREWEDRNADLIGDYIEAWLRSITPKGR